MVPRGSSPPFLSNNSLHNPLPVPPLCQASQHSPFRVNLKSRRPLLFKLAARSNLSNFLKLIRRRHKPSLRSLPTVKLYSLLLINLTARSSPPSLFKIKLHRRFTVQASQPRLPHFLFTNLNLRKLNPPSIQPEVDFSRRSPKTLNLLPIQSSTRFLSQL